MSDQDQFVRLLTFIDTLKRATSNNNDKMTWDTGSLHYFTSSTFGSSSSSSSSKLKEDSTTSSTTSSTHHSKSKLPIIIGVIVGVIVLLILLAVVFVCYRRRSRKQANRRDQPEGAGFLNRGWQKVDGEEKLGDEDFQNKPYDARDKLLHQDVPVYNARGMAYEPFRPVAS